MMDRWFGHLDLFGFYIDSCLPQIKWRSSSAPATTAASRPTIVVTCACTLFHSLLFFVSNNLANQDGFSPNHALGSACGLLWYCNAILANGDVPAERYGDILSTPRNFLSAIFWIAMFWVVFFWPVTNCFFFYFQKTPRAAWWLRRLAILSNNLHNLFTHWASHWSSNTHTHTSIIVHFLANVFAVIVVETFISTKRQFGATVQKL